MNLVGDTQAALKPAAVEGRVAIRAKFRPLLHLE